MKIPADGWVNKRGTSKREEGQTMKSLWIKKGYTWPEKCSVKGCEEEATDGAHMINSSSDSMEEWIVPTCHKHNEQEGVELELKPGAHVCKLKNLKQ